MFLYLSPSISPYPSPLFYLPLPSSSIPPLPSSSSHNQVQQAISTCIIPLATSIKKDADSATKKLLDKVTMPTTNNHTHHSIDHTHPIAPRIHGIQ